MKTVIQHSLVLHARVIVPFAKCEIAAQILRQQGWLIEKSGPNTQRLRPDPDNVEFVVSHHVGDPAQLTGNTVTRVLIETLQQALEEA